MDEEQNIYYDTFNEVDRYSIKKYKGQTLKEFNFEKEENVNYKYFSKTNYIDFDNKLFITGYMSNSIFISNFENDTDIILGVSNLKNKYTLTKISQFHKSNKLYKSYYNSEYSSLKTVFYKVYKNYLIIKIVEYSDSIYGPFPEVYFIQIDMDSGNVIIEDDNKGGYFYDDSIVSGVDNEGNIIRGIPLLKEIDKKLTNDNLKVAKGNAIYRTNDKSFIYFSKDKAFSFLEVNDGTERNLNNLRPFMRSIQNALVIYKYINKKFKIDRVITSNDIAEFKDNSIMIDEIMYADDSKIY